ncbi:MAG: YifB family Mg chelatase-like AAA ATPase [Gemmatimonadota bacterium]
MLAQVISGTVHGVEPVFVRVEVNLASGLPAFTVVGLPYGAVRESRERVATALRNSGFDLPNRRITVNLAPGDVRKEGTAFDLPIAVGLLVAAGIVSPGALHRVAFLGELGLDGTLRPVPGVLPVAADLNARGRADVIVVPEANAAEAALVASLDVVGASSLSAVVEHLLALRPIETTRVDPLGMLSGDAAAGPDLVDVRGQEMAKRALEIAAAGVHNLLLVGPPGSGKTMLALRLPGILPPLSFEEALECTRVHSVAGLLDADRPLVVRPPFRAPHHTVTEAGLVGGGTPLRPGEISLAHRGVLFLDELAEFRRGALEILRQPLEDGRVRLSRARTSLTFPARFLLVAAMNPCPCGHRGDGSDRCRCDDASVARYQGRVSGPMMDRIDLHVQVPAVAPAALGRRRTGTASSEARARVLGARTRQRERLAGVSGVHANGRLDVTRSRGLIGADRAVERLMAEAAERLGLSARGYHRVLRVARTIADLGDSEAVTVHHAAEALQYRVMERPGGRA